MSGSLKPDLIFAEYGDWWANFIHGVDYTAGDEEPFAWIEVHSSGYRDTETADIPPDVRGHLERVALIEANEIHLGPMQ